MIAVKQVLDTPIEVRVHRATADVKLKFLASTPEAWPRSQPAEVTLDMESTLVVLKAMDEGANAAQQLNPPAERAGGIKFVLTLVALTAFALGLVAGSVLS